MTSGTLVREGVRIGVDVGTVRVGVAASDPTATLATPLTVVRRRRRDSADLDAIARLAHEHNAVEVLVGLPVSLQGRDTTSTDDARGFARALAERVAPVPVRLVDERLSTVSAQRSLGAGGTSVRACRDRIDAVAAAVVLQSALDSERTTGLAPGTPVAP
jgi:putative Holliday junction resolvase